MSQGRPTSRGPGRPGGAPGAGRPARPGRDARRRPLLPGRGPLARVPVPLVFLVVVAVFVVAAVIGGTVGAVLLALLALGVAALLAATWPVLSPGARAGRVLVLAILVGVAVLQVLR